MKFNIFKSKNDILSFINPGFIYVANRPNQTEQLIETKGLTIDDDSKIKPFNLVNGLLIKPT